jgi:hypothetical protein
MLLRALLALFAVIAGVVLLAGCFLTEDCLEGPTCRKGRGSGADDMNGAAGDGGAGGAPVGPQCVVVGKAHIGLGGIDLAAKTDDVASNGDRARVKPYSALVSEYDRVLGSSNHPVLIDSTGATFGVPNPRWFLEPIPSAVYLNTAFNVAFEGCKKLIASSVAATTRPEQCASWARRFWNREATPEEINACAAVEGEPAYACASVLTSTGFLSY